MMGYSLLWQLYKMSYSLLWAALHDELHLALGSFT